MTSPVALHPPTVQDVFEARRRLEGVLSRTPFLEHPLLSAEMGCRVWIKHENHLPTGAFKVRGGLNLVAAEASERPIITASTGNHGQSVAFACRRYGVECTVVVPRGNNPEKNAAIRALGANLVEHGRDFDEAREEVERRAASGAVRYVHSANEPLLIAGVGTYALEIFEEMPDLDAVLVPVGGGSGASGLVTVRDGLGLKTRIIGVQAAGADVFARSWRTGVRVSQPAIATFAEGIATRVTFDLPFGILADRLEDIFVLSEAELADGVRVALRSTHNLAEGAGAAAIAALWKHRDAFAGQRVACVMSGGNLAHAALARIVAGGTPGFEHPDDR